MTEQNDSLILTAEIVAAYLGSNTHVKADEIPALIRSIREALNETETPQISAEETGAAKPDKRAVKKSITPDALISFLDNKPYKTLKRHLGRHGHDLKSYREQFGLPSDYPSVAPNYSAARSEMAKKIGLGAQRRGQSKAVAAEPAPSPRGRKKAAPAK